MSAEELGVLRAAALKLWSMRWPDSLHVEHQYDPAYIAQREAFVDGYLAAHS
jgi:hypothetical protein